MTTGTLTLREQAIAAHQASEAAYAATQELRHQEDAKREEEHLAMLLEQTLGIEGVEVVPAGEAGGPRAFVDGLTFTLIRTMAGDHDLGVYVSCPRCGGDILEKLPWITGGVGRDQRGLIVLGHLLANPEGHHGLCPKDLNENGEPKDRPEPQPATPTTAERLVDAMRALIYEEMGERGV